MSQSDSPPVLHPTRIAIPPECCASLTTLRHQTLAGTVELRSNVEQVSWDVQGKDVFLSQALFAAIITALDAYTALVAERLAVLGRGVGWGTARTAATQARRPEYPNAIVEGNAPGLALTERVAPYDTALRMLRRRARRRSTPIVRAESRNGSGSGKPPSTIQERR